MSAADVSPSEKIDVYPDYPDDETQGWDDHREHRWIKRKFLDCHDKAKREKKAIIAETVSNSPSIALAGLHGEYGHIFASVCGLALVGSIAYKMQQQHNEYMVTLAIYSKFRKNQKQAREGPQDEKEAKTAAAFENLSADIRANAQIFAGIKKWDLKTFAVADVDSEIEKYREILPLKSDTVLDTAKIKTLLKRFPRPKFKALRARNEDHQNASQEKSNANRLENFGEVYHSGVKKTAKLSGETLESIVNSCFGEFAKRETYKNITKGFLSATWRRVSEKYKIRGELRAFIKKTQAPTAPEPNTVLRHQLNVVQHAREVFLSRQYDIRRISPKEIVPDKAHKQRREKAVNLQHIITNRSNDGSYAFTQHVAETGFFLGHGVEIYNSVLHGHWGMAVIGTLAAATALEAYSHFGRSVINDIDNRNSTMRELLELYIQEHTPANNDEPSPESP